MLSDFHSLSGFPSVRGQLLAQVSLANYTSWRTGGLAEYLFLPADTADLVALLAGLPPAMPVTWLGLGSNVLVRDGGIKGLVIVTQGCLQTIQHTEPEVICAEAGVSCATFARYTARLGLSGVEFMAGIPGTVGGALAMNAGCYGGETWEKVCRVETVNRQGVRKLHEAGEYEVGYRHVVRPQDEWFIAGYFRLQPSDRAVSLASIKTLLAKRNASQPTGLPNCGSVFRNPVGDYAARLIEQCGLKRFMIGDAVVSDKHANFIINNGSATARDIENLIAHIRETVLTQTGIPLIPEVHMLGSAD